MRLHRHLWKRYMRCIISQQLLDLSAIKGHQWHVQLCSAILSQNVQQGFNWIVRDIVSRTFSPIVDPKPHHIAGHATSAP